MKQKYLFLLFAFFFQVSTFSQVDGDFQSKATGNWESATSWETWSSGSWINANNYPGQIAGTYAVTIKATNTITITTNLNTTLIGDLTVNGTLDIQAGSNPKQVALNTSLLQLTPTGILNFSVQKTLVYFPVNSIIMIDSGATISAACSNNTDIYIDNKRIAICNGGGANVMTFGEITAGIGTLNANITTPSAFTSTICNGTNIALSGDYSGTPNATVTYLWTVKDPNNTNATISNNTATSTSFTPSIAGQYIISFSITDGTAFSNSETKTVTVQTNVTAGSIGNAQTICSGYTPDALTSTGDGTGDGIISYEWQTNASGSFATIGSATDATYSPPALTATTTYQRRAVSTLNGVACYSAYTSPITITVADTTNPILTPEANQDVTLNASCVVTIPNLVDGSSATDNCTGTTITQTPAAGTTQAAIHNGTINVTVTATDAAGNIDSEIVVITAKDLTNPVLTVGVNQTVNTDAGFCTASVAVTDAVFSDNCSGAAIAYTLSGATIKASTAGQVGTFIFNKGITTINYTVTDAAANTTIGSKTITVTDNSSPSLTAGVNQTANTDAGFCTASVAVTDAVFSDNCSGSTIAYTLSGATIKASTAGQVGTFIFNKGITTINYTVTDAAGNTTIDSKTITVTDNSNPSLTAGVNQTANTDAGFCTASVAVTDAVFSDNCSGAAIAYTLSGATIKASTAGQVGTFIFNKGITTINYTVTDAAANTTIGSKTITVTDNSSPSLTAGVNQTANTDAGFCTASVAVTDAVFSDNCSGSTIAYTLSGATIKASTAGQVGTFIFNKGITTINYTVTDAAGNTTIDSKTITVTDNSNPSLTAGVNQTANTDAGFCTASVAVTDAVFSDNCSGAAIAYTLSGATIKASTAGQVGTFIFNKGITTINYTVTDAAANTTIGSKTITVTDNSSPSLTAGVNQTANTDAGFCTASVAVTDAVFSDNCSGSTIAYTLSGATIKASTAGQVGTFIFNKGITTINYTVTDAAANTTIGSKTITVTDNSSPSLTAGVNQTANTDAGFCTASVAVTDAVFSDNCSGSTIAYTLSGATIKASTAGQVGTFIFNKGITTINYTVTDAAGNTTIDSKTITVTDNSNPSLTAGVNQTANTDAGFCTASVAVTDAVFSDNCSGSTIAYTLSGATIKASTAGQVGTFIFNKGITTINYTVTDAAANTTIGSKTITVTDNSSPSLTAGVNQTANTDAGFCTASVTVTDAVFSDNCSGAAIAYTLSGATIKASTAGQVGTFIFNKGITTINYTVTDAAGNTTIDSKTITVTDNSSPSLTAGVNQTANTDAGFCTASVAVTDAVFSDNCSGAAIAYTLSGATTKASTAGQVGTFIFNKGVTTINYTVTDAAANTTIGSKTITVTDNSSPSLTAGVNQTANTDAGFCTASVAVTDAVFSDNCSGAAIAYTLSGATIKASTAGQVGTFIFNKGITTINYTVTDAAANTTIGSKTITVTDNSSPSLTAGVNQTANTDAGFCTASVAVTDAVFSDNCSGSTIAYTLSGATIKASTAGQVGTFIFNKGITTINYTVTDAAGNTTIDSKTITVTDNSNPSLTAGVNQTANTDAGFCTASVAVTDAVFSDNCSGSTIAYTLSGATIKASTAGQVGTFIFNKGITTINYTVTDAAANTTIGSKTITVTDNSSPSLTAGVNQTANTDAGLCTASVVVQNTVFSDNCSGATISYSLSGTTIKATTAGQIGTYIFNTGVTTVHYIVTDAAGNTSTGTKTITVNDNIKPTITAPPSINTTTNIACTATGVVLGTPTTADNCAVSSVTNNHPSTTYTLGSTTVIWTVTDSSGNTATANQIVTVTDNVPPTITCPGNINANTSANGTGDCYTTVNISTPTTNDNCGIASVVARVSGIAINTATYQFPIGNTTVSWTVTDNAGLTASCNQTITVIDNENPSISCPGDQNVNFNNNCQYSLLDYTSLATASDNCDTNVTITQSPAPGTLISAATTIVTLTARDDANRTSTCTFTVSAIDNIAPTAVCKNYTAYLSSNGTINVAAVNLNNGSNDNCGIANMTVTPSAFNCSNVGSNNVTFTVYDNNGNSNSCNAVVTVVDNTPPTMICKNFVVVIDPLTRVATIKASDIDNGSNDACGIDTLSVYPSVFPDSPNIYTATTTLTAVDVNGNSNSCTATVTVEPPKNLFTYLTGQIVNPIPDNPQPPSALVEVTACPGGITVPKDIQFTLQAIGTYNLQASDVLNWEYSNDNGETWIVIPNSAGLLTYTLTGLTSDTFVRLRITDADNSSLIKTSAEAYARFLPPDEPPIIISHSALDICLGSSVTINAESFYDQPEGQFGKGGKFNYAQPDGWRVDGLDGFFPASGNNNSEPTWKETNSNSNPNTTFSGINYDTSDNTKFAIAHAAEANRITTLETPVFSTIGMTSSDAILTFYTAYYFCNGGSGKIELSFDAGNTYTVTLNTMQNDVLTAGNTTGVHAYKGANCTKQYLVADSFRYTSLNLGAYAGLAGLRVKFTFNSGPAGGTCNNVTFPKHASNNCTTNQSFNVGSGWAIDDVGFTFGTVDDELEWTDEDGNVIATGTTATVTPATPGIREYGVTTLVNGCRTDNDAGTNYVNINTSLAYAGEDYTPLASNCGENTIQLNAYDNTVSAVTNFTKGAWKNSLYIVPDIAAGDTDYPGTGVTGTWSVISATSTSCGNSATFSSATDPNAIFTADPGSYTLKWTLTNGCFDEKNITIIDCKSVDFDGTNDYVSFKDNYNLNSAFSIEAWVKPNSTDGTRTLFSRKDAGNNTNGYDLSIANGQVQFNWYTNSGANSITTGSYVIGTDRWYHLAVTFNGAAYILYVDGLEIATKNGTAPAVTANTIEALLGAMDQSTTKIPTNYFHGWIDEVKIWNKALGVEQIRQMMNQEIDVSGSDVSGVVIPMKIFGSDNDQNSVEDNPLLWNNLLGYYRMNNNCGDLAAYKGISGRLHNINASQQQTAPIPYTSRISNQTWNTDSTWTNYDVWDVPNSLGINNQPINWNIVKINHKVTENTQDLTLLGLIVMSNELIITNSGTQNENNLGHGLWITHYLKLDGKIDLVGESQLVQKRYNTDQFNESVFEESSTGYIERDQQGKQNSFNYNYWSSPVSNRGAANNSTYSVADVLRDGTDSSNPKTITFGDGAYFADGALSIPIKISNRWIYSFSSLTPNSNSNLDNYYQWQYKSSTGQIAAGEGYTMKGTGGSTPIAATQNYVFVGKPNSATISKFLAIDQTILLGNPYPSALDADEFIKDNLKDCAGCRGTANTFGGVLYFWDHFGLSNNHNLAQYEAGYATYTLTGGVVAVSNVPLASNIGTTGSKTPQRYIPVGQAFFINAATNNQITGNGVTTGVQGGTVVFKNSQRAFVRETLASSIFMKTAKTKTTNNQNITSLVDTRLKIRLGFDSPTGSHRQILLGADKNTTNKFDIGYDAQMIDITENDMYWELEETALNIQAITNFDNDQIVPIGIKIAKDGIYTIKIDSLENITTHLDVYLFDAASKTYYDLRKEKNNISLTPGDYNNRFSLQFVNKLYNINDTNVDNGIITYYTNENKMLNIKNYFTDVVVQSVSLFNILKQNIGNWKITDSKQNHIQIPIKNVSSAVYLVLIKTDKGEFSQKIIIK